MTRPLLYRVQVRQADPTGDWYWRVVAPNGQVVSTSETYASKGNALRAARRFWNVMLLEAVFRLEDE